MGIFRFFKVAAVRHLGFLKRFLELRGPICVTMPNFVAIGQTVAEL